MFWKSVISSPLLRIITNHCVNSTAIMSTLHSKCRNTGQYLRSGIQRLAVPDEKVPWTVDWMDYNPPEYTLSHSKSWEDPSIRASDFRPKWNSLDDRVDRRSHTSAPYEVREGYPLNPEGRTGLKGRGTLGKWGPNHAADPLVTRWKSEANGKPTVDCQSKKKILQFVAIKRKDCGEWAIPGGMVDPGERVSVTLKREFMEEATDSLSLSPQEKGELERKVEETFSKGKEIYRGYVDDPRNTDNSWMETVVYNFHDDTGDAVGRFTLTAGDDAAEVRWTDINRGLSLYASHKGFIKQVATELNAHW